MTPKAVVPGQILNHGDVIRTGADGWIAIVLSDETLLQLNRNSRFTLKDVAENAGWNLIRNVVVKTIRNVSSSRYMLNAGEGWFRNKNRNTRIDIEAFGMVAGVRGTELDLKLSDDGVATVAVLEGRITASNDLSSIDVRTGEQAVARPGKPITKSILLTPEDAVQWTIPVPPLFDDRGVPSEVRVALADLQAGNVKQTERQMADFTLRNHEEASGWSLLALTRIILGRKAEALQAADKAVQAAPDSANAFIIQGYAFQAAFDMDRALKSFKQALRLDGENVLALVNLARLQFGMELTDQALENLEKARRLAPQNGNVYNLEGFVLLAGRRTDEAIAAFRIASELDPSLGEPHMGLGLAYMRKGDSAQVLEEITTAVLLEPRRSLFLSYWGKMLYQLERFDKALDVLKTAAILDPRDPTPEFYQALILRDLNRPTEAIAAINRAVSLNDNRAVYRSRFLLDRDLASKNIDLSVLYNQLGLSAWAKNKAMASIKQDYNNSGGHLFLSGALRDADDRSWAFAGESLLSRLLQPANVNTFNTFNEYTAFFEKPAVHATVSGSFGEMQTSGGEVFLDGAIPALNLALAAGGLYQETDGWRSTNGERAGNFAVYGKWDPTMKDGLMAVYSSQKSKQKDTGYPRYEWDALQEPDAWTENSLSRVELGYHHHFSPRSDVLLHFSRLSSTTDIHDLRSFSQDLSGPPPMTAIGKTLFSGWNETPYRQMQGQFLFKAGAHQLILGCAQYWGENDLEGVSSADVNQVKTGGILTDVSINLYRNPIQTETSRSSQSYYLQDIWKINRYLSAEGALYFDRMENSDPLYKTAWTLNEFNPRFGIIFTPTAQDTFRLAAFRYLLPYITSRIDPMDIGGITVLRNNFQGAAIREGDLTWEREWRSGFLSIGGFYLEKEYAHQLIDASTAIVEQRERGRMKGAEVVINQLLWHGVGLAASYRYQDLQDESLPEANREDHRVTAGLKYVHALGFSAGISETWRHSRFEAISRDDEDIWITDVKIGYEFPGRKGSVNLECRNLFDQRFNWITDYFVFAGRAPSRETILTLSVNF
ncbi:MAG: tetratricopeptide repeat protein [Syntrophales bacterium]|jgi:tetratricopeptide (TPR) repeat protein|nr:tetratricopeptide repeat protein [Syntrophales bacterium]